MQLIAATSLAILALATTAFGQPMTTKSFAPSTISVGETSVLTFDVVNTSTTVTLTGVSFTDNLPSGLIVASPNNINGFCTGGSAGVANGPPGGTTTSLLFTTLVPSSHCTYNITVKATTPGVKNNSTGPVQSSAGDGAPGLATLTVTAPPTITKNFGAATVPPNGTTTLSFTITNPNPSMQLTGVGFTDTLPPGVLVGTPNNLTGSCGGGVITATAGSGSISLATATLAGGASCTFGVDVIGKTEGVKMNTTSPITSIELGNGLPATATLRVVSTPTLTKAFTDSQIQLFGPSTTALSFTVTNPNSSTTLTGLAFTDQLPSGLVVATPNGQTGTCGSGNISAVAGSSTISLSGATLAPGASCTFSVDVTGTAIGAPTNTTSTLTSTEAPAGAAASASTSVTDLFFFWFFAGP